MKEVDRAPSRGGLVGMVTSILAVLLAACGGTTEPPETPPADPTYTIERSLVQTVEGECAENPGDWIGTFQQDGESLVFSGRVVGTGQAPVVWTGTIDGAANFTLRLTEHPFAGLTFERWTAEGSFTADRSRLTATERFRGTLTDGRFCEGILSWSGRRV